MDAAVFPILTRALTPIRQGVDAVVKQVSQTTTLARTPIPPVVVADQVASPIMIQETMLIRRAADVADAEHSRRAEGVIDVRLLRLNLSQRQAEEVDSEAVAGRAERSHIGSDRSRRPRWPRR